MALPVPHAGNAQPWAHLSAGRAHTPRDAERGQFAAVAGRRTCKNAAVAAWARCWANGKPLT